jgi:hypothetical protein
MEIPNGLGPTGGYILTPEGFGAIIKFRDFNPHRSLQNQTFLNIGHTNHRLFMFLSRIASNRKYSFYNSNGFAGWLDAGTGANAITDSMIMAMSGNQAWLDGVLQGSFTHTMHNYPDMPLRIFNGYVINSSQLNETPGVIVEAVGFYRNDALGQNIQAITDAMAQI